MSIRHVTVTTDRAFDEVVAAVHAGLGRVPDFGELVQRLMAADDAGEFEAMVTEVEGSSGVIEFSASTWVAPSRRAIPTGAGACCASSPATR